MNKKNLKKASLGATAAVAGIALVGANETVHADTVETSEAPVAQSQSATQTTNAVDKAQATADSAAQVTNQAKAVADQAQSAVDHQQAVVNSDQANVNDMQQKVASAQANVQSAQDALNDAQAKANSASQTVTQAQSALSDATSNVAAKQVALSAAQVAEQQAQTNVTSAQVVANSAAQAVTDAENAKATADQSVQTAQNNVNSTQATINKLNDELNNTNTITLPSGYMNALKKYYNYTAGGESNLNDSTAIQLSNEISQYRSQALTMNNYKSNSTDKNVTVDPTNLDEATRIEFSIWVADLINQIRAQEGYGKVTVTPESVEHSQLVADEYNNDGWNIAREHRHDEKALNRADKKYGHISFSEEDAGSDITGTTLDSIKHQIYSRII